MFIDPVVMTCKPNDKYNGKFEKIEFLWKTHTVLPPSLHMSGKHYEFINCHKPENPPLNVQRFELEKIVAQFSDTNVEYGSTYVKPIFRGKGLSYNAVFPLEINRYWNEEKI